MIAYFPKMYEDELIYSVLSRFCVHSGFLSNRDALRTIYGNVNTRIDFLFMGKVEQDIKRTMLRDSSLEELIMQHTPFSYYARFMPEKRMQMDSVCAGNSIKLPRTGVKKYLRYCPDCAKEEVARHGEAFYHRGHQISKVCIKHGTRLIDTDIEVGMDKRGAFFPLINLAEESKSVTPKELDFAVYQEKLLNRHFDYDEVINDEAFREKMQGRNNKSIYEEMKLFYQDTDINFISNYEQIHKMLSGTKTSTDCILQLAFFLGIDENNILTKERKQKCIVKKNIVNRSSIDWSKDDAYYLPIIRLIIASYMNPDTMKRVTERAISCELGFPSKRINKLPKCKAEIAKHAETIDEYRLRRIRWAVQKMNGEHIPITWGRVQILTGIMPQYKKQLLDLVNRECAEDKDILQEVLTDF